ncbi:hypothetical protein SAMN05443431_1164 [Olleya namhaensis]|uniref:Uncharacterized protein n=1 Tax=Olleya namhaensis TaxID=1144750 RepID=A0A1I3TBH6_9FLAO|nr:hypothetical protein SAMN05443431_1164 [Olleya namhaensis]
MHKHVSKHLKKTVKYINILILLLIFSCSNNKTKSNDEKNVIPNIDTLRYSYNGFNNGLKLDLLSNGTFINEDYLFGCTGGGERKKVFGTYKMDSVNLKLIPNKVEFTEYPMDMESKPITTNVNYGIDSLKIKTEFQIVSWENKKYLLSDFYDFGWSLDKENDYIRFADYLNSGLEPKSSGRYLATEIKDTIKTEFDLKQIPEKWQSYFLKEPVSAKIRKIKKITDPKDIENISWLIELDKGKKDRMNNRLTLETKDGDFFIEVDSVLTNRSFGKYYMPDFTTEKYPIGTELRTKWE